MTPKIQQAAMALTRARSVIALTGAGISVESGIPPFRGKGGLWEKIDPMAYAHIDAYERDPEQAWKVLYGGLKEVLDRAKPNNGHLGLSQLESMGFVKTIITQNIDGLHQQSGSNDVIEFHGTFASHHCMACGQGAASNSINCEPPPPRCACGGLLRPDVVMFGELIPPEHLQRGQMLASTCDLMLVVGTSATVEPAAHLPVIAKRAGATIIEINPETTPLSDHVSDITLLGKAGRVMGELVASVGRISRGLRSQ